MQGKERGRQEAELARSSPGNASVLPAGTMPRMSFVYPAFGRGPTFYMPQAALIRRLDDMLSSPLGQHILDYEPPRVFGIPAFATFDGSTNP